MRECPECGGPVEARFHYCPWCSAPQRRKLVEFFRPHTSLENDRGKALRVSRYFGRAAGDRHVRFSVWNETGRAEAAVSVDEAEAQRLASFILAHGAPPPSLPRRFAALLALLRPGYPGRRDASLGKCTSRSPNASASGSASAASSRPKARPLT
jgi:hypothetical protein